MIGLILGFVGRHWQAAIVAGLMAVLSSYAGIMRIERDHARNALDSYKSEVQKAESIQEAKNAQTQSNWTNATINIDAASKKQQQSIKDYYEKRELAYRTASLPPAPGGVSSTCKLQTGETSSTTSRIDEVPGNCLSIAEQGAECAQQVIDWQDWYMELIKGQVF